MRYALSIAILVGPAACFVPYGMQKPNPPAPSTSDPGIAPSQAAAPPTTESVSPDWTYSIVATDVSKNPQIFEPMLTVTRSKQCQAEAADSSGIRPSPHTCHAEPAASGRAVRGLSVTAAAHAPVETVHVVIVDRAGRLVTEGDTDYNGIVMVDAKAFVARVGDAPFSATINGKQVELAGMDPLLAKVSDVLQKTADAKQAMQARSDDEVKTGKCFNDRVANLQQALAAFKTIIESDQFILDAQTIDVATPKGISLSVPTPLGGEYHVIAAGYSKLTLDATNAKGQPATLASPYVQIVRGNNWDAASRVLQGNAGDNFKVVVKGSGCFLLMSFKHY